MFYHISKIDHGFEFLFEPRVPDSAYEHKEGNIPRVCVCPEIFYCLRAITGNEELYSFDILLQMRLALKPGETIKHPAIYATEEIAYLPPRCSDFRLNKEHWFLKPITMKRIGYLDLTELVKGKIAILHNCDEISEDAFTGKGKDVLITDPEEVSFEFV